MFNKSLLMTKLNPKQEIEKCIMKLNLGSSIYGKLEMLSGIVDE